MLPYVLLALLLAPLVAARVAALFRPLALTPADAAAIDYLAGAVLSELRRSMSHVSGSWDVPVSPAVLPVLGQRRGTAGSPRVRLVTVLPPLLVEGVAA